MSRTYPMENLLRNPRKDIILVCYESDSWWPVATVLYENEEQLRKDVQKQSDDIPQYNIVWNEEEDCFFCVHPGGDPKAGFNYYDTPWGIIVDSNYMGF